MKIAQTNLEHFGVENPFAAAEIKEKIKKHHLETYEFEHPMKNPKLQTKQKPNTNLFV